MALLTASDLRKDIAGQPLLRGVSFKLERRERLTLAGRNGAGKTTLLRMLAGESSIDGGEPERRQGGAGSRSTTSAPRASGAARSSEYLLSGCAEELAIEAELAKLERAMADGDGDEATLARYAAAQARLEARGGYLWRNRASDMAHGLGFRDEDLERGRSTPSPAASSRAPRWRARWPPAPTCCCSTSPPTTSTSSSLEWLEQTLAALDAAVVLVAHDRWFLEAVGTAVLELQAGRSRFFAGSWHSWRREQAARELALGRAIDGPAGGDRAHRTVHRALPLQGLQGATGAVAGQAARQDGAPRARPRATARGLEFAFSTPAALRAGDLRAARRPRRGGAGAGAAAP